MPTTTQTPLKDLVALHREAIASGGYGLLGQIELIETVGRGRMDFRRAGPLLGQMRDRNDLLIATEWPKLPALTRALDEPCSACAVTCEECAGKKVSMCQRCGGAGKERRPANCSSCVARGSYDPHCPECKGLPMVEHVECPACIGAGSRKCNRCNGAGSEGSGIAGGGRRGKPCPACAGQGKKILREEQPLERYAHGQIEGYAALGPVRTIVFHSLEGPARIDICDIRPDANGNLAVVLLEGGPGREPNAYLVGGLPMIRPRLA